MEYETDLKFLYDKLSLHPLFVDNPSKFISFKNIYNNIRTEEINSYNQFISFANMLTCFFCDGHTNIEIPYTERDKCLNLPCYWSGEKLFIASDYKDVKINSEIVAIENKPVKEIIQLMSNKIPHENIYLVKSRMINYPYKNYHVFSELNIKTLFDNKNEIEITFLSDQQIIKQTANLSEYNNYLDFKDTKDFIFYEIENDTAILHLTACIYNEKYKSVLNTLANLCKQEKIKTLVLDLSENMGGNSAVIEEFIKYVDIEKFKRYEMIDYTKQPPAHLTYRNDIIINHKNRKCFPKNIFCKVSHDTFSSARTFAVTLKDNGIAKIVGAPTGGKPNSYGMPQKYKMPNSNINFRVSRCLFLRPDISHDDDISLFPD